MSNETVGESINLEATAPDATPLAPQDLNAPVEPLDIRLNFNCMLYLFTEIVALMNELVLTLKNNDNLSDEDIKNIYEITANKESLTRVYQPVFNRFMEYYIATKKDVTGEGPEVVGDSNAPAENLATPVKPAATASTAVMQEETS